MTLENISPMTEMDGRNLYYAFIAGANKVIANQVELNRINVFPVNDGDTGSNLASTIRSVLDSLTPSRSYKVTADRIAEATLLNARGNSGIIFAQFFYGLSNETGDCKAVTLEQFATSMKKSVSYVYDAVARPVEGTMLTVIRDMADFVSASWHKFTDFRHMMESSYDVVNKSLLETRTKLEILEKNKVVDAGAKGFVLFIEGITEFIRNRNIRELVASRSVNYAFPKIEEVISGDIEFRYCTEAVIKNCKYDKNELIAKLEKFGNSVAVAGSDKIRRIHVHTDNPSDLFDNLRDAGTFTFQKADDMIRYNQTVNARKWNIALVTDSACDLSPELIDRYQIHMLPLNINFGDNHYLDKITIQPDKFYSLLESKGPSPKSAQINEQAFVNLYSHLASHYDSVIAVHLGDKLSGTYYSSLKGAAKVSREFDKPITVINSRNLSGGLGLLVLRAAEAIASGLSHNEVVSRLESWVSNARIFVSVVTMKYMIRGGRVSRVKGLLAKILNINPIVTLDKTGKAIVFDKAFNQKANMAKVMDHIENITREKPVWNYIVLHANNPSAAEWYSEKMEGLTGKKPVSVVNISPVIGANAGIGAASVALMFE